MNGWVALGNGMAGFAVGLFFVCNTRVVVAPMAARAGGEEEMSADWIFVYLANLAPALAMHLSNRS